MPVWGRPVIAVSFVAVGLQDHKLAIDAYEELQNACGTEHGWSSDRVLGLLAILLEKHDAVAGHFEDALTFCRDNGIKKELA